MSHSPTLVSVLVPTYNAAPYLAELCESIQAQTHQNFEVLVLDDGSDDGTGEVLAPFQKDPRFHLLRWSPNRGVNAATAALLRLMKGEYWCNPGADDVLQPEFLAQRLELLKANLGAVMVHGPAEFIDANGAAADIDFPEFNPPTRLEGRRALNVLLQHNLISTSSVMARSDITRQLLTCFLCDWRFAQDWYLWLLHLSTGLDLLWDPRKLHKYRVHKKSLTWDPARSATKSAEIRLVPLCALSAAARFSPLAAEAWFRWRKTLYGAWLLRAASLHSRRILRPDWFRQAGAAYYGRHARRRSLYGEVIKHPALIALTAIRERRAARSQAFGVSGIAQIGDPIFSEHSGSV